MRSVKLGSALAGIVALAAVMIFVLMPANTVLTQTPVGQPLNCDLSQYKAQPGLTAVVEQDALAVTWSGTNGSELRARYGITNGQPSSASSPSGRTAGSGRRSGKTSRLRST